MLSVTTVAATSALRGCQTAGVVQRRHAGHQAVPRRRQAPPPQAASPASSPPAAVGGEQKALDEPTDRLLRWAAAHDLSSLDVAQLVELGADVTASDPDTKETALHLAAARGNGEAVGALVLAGADPRATDSAQRTPLHRAAEAVAAHRGAAPHEEGEPPMPTAAGMAVAGLVESGADLDAADSRGITPRTILLRHIACEVGLMPLDTLLGKAMK